MTRRCIALGHVAFEDLGLLEPVLQRRGYTIEPVQAGAHALSARAWREADLVVVLGGPLGVGDLEAYPWLGATVAGMRQRLKHGLPLLGLCLGAQLMAAALGARVAPLAQPEIGWAPIELSAEGADSALRHLRGIDVLHWHGDAFDLPPGATGLASTRRTPHQAFSVGASALALQFHPEVDPGRIEPWLIGHAVELRQAAVDVRRLRDASGLRRRAVLARAARGWLNDWLDGAELGPRAGGRR